jgi:hypothetical protein
MGVEVANPGTNFSITNVSLNVGITMKTPRSAGRIVKVKPAVA